MWMEDLKATYKHIKSTKKLYIALSYLGCIHKHMINTRRGSNIDTRTFLRLLHPLANPFPHTTSANVINRPGVAEAVL